MTGRSHSSAISRREMLRRAGMGFGMLGLAGTLHAAGRFGLASAAAIENLDHSVRGSKALAGLLQVPVLAVIPYMETQEQKRHRRRIAAIIAVSAVATFILALLLVHLFWIPLDVLWFRALRKLEVYVPGTVSDWAQPLAAIRFLWIA